MVMTAHRPFRLFVKVLLLAVPGILSMVPSISTMLAGALPPGGPSPTVVVFLASLQSLLLVAAAAGLGTWLAPKVGFGAPALTSGEIVDTIRRVAPGALLAGIGTGAVMVLVEVLVFRPYLPEALYMLSRKPAPVELIPAFLYGGIVEEILIRWGLMSLFTWLLYRLFSGGKGQVRPVQVWVAITAAALLFGAGHLPAIGAMGIEMTTPLLIRTLVQNGLPGMVFGWFFARRGLESAMFAHIGTHVGLFLLRTLLA